MIRASSSRARVAETRLTRESKVARQRITSEQPNRIIIAEPRNHPDEPEAARGSAEGKGARHSRWMEAYRTCDVAVSFAARM